MDHLSQQFAHLELVNILPEELEQREFVVNRALDVRSASMKHLAVSLRHDSTPLGTRFVKTFVLGDPEVVDSKAYLDTCIENYHRALSDIVGIRMIIKVWEIVKGTCS